jgi:hypothetical protein
MASLLMAIAFGGCSLHGYEYSIIEDNNYYLLKGNFFNHNPIVKVKAYWPHSFLIKKAQSHISISQDIRSTFSKETIIEGFIVDDQNKIEIRLVLNKLNPNLAEENGVYSLKSRTKVDDLIKYMEKQEVEILKDISKNLSDEGTALDTRQN